MVQNKKKNKEKVSVTMITGFYAGLLAILMIVLIVNVIRNRLKFQIGIGDGGNHILHKAIRVHANFAETVPFTLLLMALCDYNGTKPILIHIMGITLVVCRILHAHGMYKTSVRSMGRTVGILGTMAVMAFAALILILRFVLA